MPRIALVTHDYGASGGVSTMTAFLHRVLRESGRFEPEIISLALSSSDSTSVRLRSPATWRRGVQRIANLRDGVAFVHVGARWSELEFQRYRPRALLTEMLDSYDLVQFVTGTPPWICAAVKVKRPKFLWTATTARADRNTRLKKARPLRRLWLSLMTRVAEKYERRGLQIASVVFALSDYTLASIRGILGTNVGKLAACGVDTGFFHPAPAAIKKYILCVGRLDDPRKNIPLLIKAYARARHKVPNIPDLLLVGPPPLPEAHQLIREHDLKQSVRLLGPQKPSELPEIYRSAICLALSSDEEGLGIVLLEAMACGVPVISTACGGPDTVIENGRTGFLTPPGDANALAEKLVLLLGDSGLQTRMGERARKTCEERFSLNTAGRVFIEHYAQTLSSPDLNRDLHQKVGA